MTTRTHVAMVNKWKFLLIAVPLGFTTVFSPCRENLESVLKNSVFLYKKDKMSESDSDMEELYTPAEIEVGANSLRS